MKIILALLFISSLSFGVIHETKKMEDVFVDATKETVFVTDLDNTLMETVQMLGSDQYFEYKADKITKEHIAKGIAEETAVKIGFDQELTDWIAILKVTKVRAVEKETPRLIKSKQIEGIKMMALTMRPPELALATEKHLRSLSVDFTARAVLEQDVELEVGKYISGVLYLEAGHVDKGVALMRFFQQTGIRPARVVFVDDKIANVRNVDRALTEAKIPVASWRYGAADAQVKAFDKNVAETQEKYFAGILSDEAAATLVKAGLGRRAVGKK